MHLESLKGVPIERIPFLSLSKFNSSFVFVCNDEKKASYIHSLIQKTQKDFKIIHLDFFDSDVYESTICDYKRFIKRAKALFEIVSSEKLIVITSLSALNYKVPEKGYFKEQFLINPSKKLSLNSLIDLLASYGYLRSSVVRNPGEFSVRGGILDVFIPIYDQPIRIDFLGNEIESIRSFDLESQISVKALESAVITKCSEIVLNETARSVFTDKFPFSDVYIKEAVENGNYFPGIEWYLDCFHERTTSLASYFPKDTKFIFDFELEKHNKRFFEDAKEKQAKFKGVLPISQIFANSIQLISDSFEILKTQPFQDNAIFRPHATTYNIKDEKSLKKLLKEGSKNTVFSVKSQGALNILSEILQGKYNAIENFADAIKGQVNVVVSDLDEGFLSDNLDVYTEKELFGQELKFARKPKSKNLFNSYANLSINDYVVHEKYGIAVFEGLVNLKINDVSHDFLMLRYKNDDKLYVPVENISLVTRYGEADANIALDALKSGAWASRKSKVHKKLLIIANDLLKLSAQRKLNKCVPFQLFEDYDEFCKGFGHIETDDQQAAIDDVIEDLTINDIPMDRLVCGDVGFGKTEVALRAAFITASNGKQVVLLAPTTILVSQHYKNFLKRFERFDIKICQLSRFVSASEMKQNIKDIESGNARIIIATHTVLSGKIKFNDLGLVIIDEEQHFGVRHKELLKKDNKNAHFMTLSATPIPRTLQLAISGVKELSMITTPPMDRLPIRTIICEFEKNTIKDAIEQEIKIGGQVFVVTPRVEFLDDLFNFVSKLFPELVIGKVHGKSKDIEEILRDFCDHKINILVSTNIIDSGIDIPNANTILIHRVDLFGLSQLYQLRGRVGRSKRQAYAYLLLNDQSTISNNAKKRLEVLNNLNKLGSGFSLASHDLDIRGAGNLLGEEQSGYIKEVGVELYQSMLQEAIMMIQSGANIDQIGKKEIHINLGVPALIPEDYVQDSDLRLEMYRKIGGIEEENEISVMEYELSDRFGVIPQEVRNLLTLISIKISCSKLNIEKLDVGAAGITFSFFDNDCKNVDALMMFLNSKELNQYAESAKIRADNKVVILKKWKTVEQRTKDVAKIMEFFVYCVKKS